MRGDINDDLRIDPSQLDIEWLQQASLMMKYSGLAADARKSVDLLKEKCDVVEADLSRKIRKRPSKYKIEKGTEKEITVAIKGQDIYKEANSELIDAKHEADVLQSVCRSLEHKKRALEQLVTLQGQNYFAGPREPRNLEKEWDKSVKQISARKKITVSKRRRKK